MTLEWSVCKYVPAEETKLFETSRDEDVSNIKHEGFQLRCMFTERQIIFHSFLHHIGMFQNSIIKSNDVGSFETDPFHPYQWHEETDLKDTPCRSHDPDSKWHGGVISGHVETQLFCQFSRALSLVVDCMVQAIFNRSNGAGGCRSKGSKYLLTRCLEA